MQKLADLFEIRGRFHRSIQLSRDWAERQDLSQYIPTRTSRELATRITTHLRSPDGSRAWSITGPYGSGKSAFALFLSDLLAHREQLHPDAARLRAELALDLPPLLPILLVGQRAPLAYSLVDALKVSQGMQAPGSSYITAQELAALFERAAEAAMEQGRCTAAQPGSRHERARKPHGHRRLRVRRIHR